ncbi:MAG: transposase [Phyllobacterium sp.]|uniref:transposase n=1 Tax=Phyllobacterium sp. TaxID=1871046 RepID=UPI0030F180A0
MIDALGDADGVLVVDETGFVKKGEHSVGVARQYSGTAGRVENCQVGVFGAENQERRAKACVPEDVAFATKPAMAREMVPRILDEGIPCAFVLADALYGSDYQFRCMLEKRGQAYVLAIRSNHVLRFFGACRFPLFSAC